MHISVTAMVTDSAVTVLSVATTFTVIQWIPGLTICQGDVKNYIVKPGYRYTEIPNIKILWKNF